ncbi:MAG: SGNH/GDSL hydrolase family protein [Clostridia bacterium]|nr:SGNH/GDSL hydrolase family protein [Clostridia bacterium]
MELKGKIVDFLGDSITEGSGTSGDGYRFVDVFARKTGALTRNHGIGGTRIARQIHLSQYPHWDQNYVDRADNLDPGADVIVVFGGTNDFGHGDAPFGKYEDTDDCTFCGALRTLLTKLMTKYPYATIVMMTPLHRLSENVTTNEIGLPCRPLRDYVEMEKRMAAEFSVPVLDLWSVSGIQPAIPANFIAYTADGLHPNDRGAERVADRLIAFLNAL